MPPKTASRISYIDNIRLCMIILVVMVHVNVTYSGMGSWYYVEKEPNGLLSTVIMGIFGSFTQAYFMGFLFFIAGYFVPAAYDKKGFGLFIRDRLFRLGIPLLVYCVLIHPFIVTVLLGNYFGITDRPAWLIGYFKSFSFIGSNGPLWFAFALLVFTCIYALIRMSGISRLLPVPAKISSRTVMAFILIVAIGSFLVRIVQPIGTNIINMQLCFFTQYIVLFIAGIAARRNDWLTTLSRQFGIRWAAASCVLGTAMWALLIVFGGPFEGHIEVINGGLRWQSAVYCLWESFFCAGICLGFIVIFRDFLNRQNHFLKALSDNAFGVYVFHAPVLIAVSLLCARLMWPPLPKALFVAALAITASFAAAVCIRLIPGMKKIF